MNSKELYREIKNRYPLLIAVILLDVAPEVAIEVLNLFDKETKLKILFRMGLLPKTTTVSAMYINSLIAKNNYDYDTERSKVHKLYLIYKAQHRELRMKVINHLEEVNPEIIDQIRVPIIEDLTLLSKKDIKRVIRKANKKKLFIALHFVENNTMDLIESVISFWHKWIFNMYLNIDFSINEINTAREYVMQLIETMQIKPFYKEFSND